MSIDVHAWSASDLAPGTLGDLDLFSLGRQASSTRDARLGRRGSFVRTRQMLPSGGWHGPRDAAESYVEETDLRAVGGLAAARSAGVALLVGAPDSPQVAEAAAAGLRVLLRVPYRLGEDDAERLGRLALLARAGFEIWGVMPAPVGEPYGLDTLRFFALCRLALSAHGAGAGANDGHGTAGPSLITRFPHLLADVGALGSRLAQMAFGFGADELRAPIVAERALRLGLNAHNPALTRKEAATLIRGAGLTPGERLADGMIEEVL